MPGSTAAPVVKTFKDEVTAAFKELDVEKKGKLSADVLEGMWVKILPDCTAMQLRDLNRVFTEVDLDDDGEVSLEELLFFLDPDGTEDLKHSKEEKQILTLAGMGSAWKVSPPASAKETLWCILNLEEAGKYLTHKDWLRKSAVVVQTISQFMILVSIVNMMVESEPTATLEARKQGASAATFIVEATTIAFFTLELIARVISAPSQKTFWREGYTWIDLLAIAPFYLIELGLASEWTKGLSVLRALRLTRLLRILKVGRHSVGIHLMVLSVRNALLPLCWLLFVLFLATVLFSALVFHAETGVSATLDETSEKWYRDVNSSYVDAGQEIAFESIHASMWWAITTLTTTGYGDVVPRTGPGKAVGGLTMLAGILLLAFPTTILTQQFSKVFAEYEKRRIGEEHKAAVRSKILQKQYATPNPLVATAPLEPPLPTFSLVPPNVSGSFAAPGGRQGRSMSVSFSAPLSPLAQVQMPQQVIQQLQAEVADLREAQERFAEDTKHQISTIKEESQQLLSVLKSIQQSLHARGNTPQP